MSKTKSAHSNRVEDDPASIKTAENSEVFKVFVTDLAWQIAIVMVAPPFIGFWLDGKFDAKPVFSLIGVLIGAASAVLVVRRFVKNNSSNDSKADKK